MHEGRWTKLWSDPFEEEQATRIHLSERYVMLMNQTHMQTILLIILVFGLLASALPFAHGPVRSALTLPWENRIFGFKRLEIHL